LGLPSLFGIEGGGEKDFFSEEKKQKTFFQRWFGGGEPFWAALLLLLGVGICFAWLDRAAVWNDEGFSYFVARGDFSNLLSWIAADTHPPLYYLALMVWLKLGHSVFVLRSLSALATVVALGFTYLAGRRVLAPGWALLAMLLFATSPLALYWAEKARPYAFQTMLVAISLWGFTRVVTDPAASSAWIGARLRRRDARGVDIGWLAYAAAGGLAMLAQHPAGFYVLGCNAGALIVLARTLSWRFFGNWVVAQLALAAIWLSWLPHFLAQVHSHLTPAEIAQKHEIFLITLQGLAQRLLDLLSVAELNRPQPVLLAVYLGLLAIGLRAAILSRAKILPVFAVVLAPLLVCVGAYFAVHPVFGYILSTFDWLLVPYAIVIAGCVAAVPGVLPRAGVIALLVAANAWGLKNTYQYDPPPTDQAARLVAAQARPGDGIVFSTYGSENDVLGYYLRDFPVPVGGLIPRQAGVGEIHSAATAAGYQRLWVVLPVGERAAFDPVGWRPVGHWDLGRITVGLFAAGQ